ncbi:hypothetical protein [Salinarimonas ramus]|uniref:Uncharacterized protein n=1 Tax=Salinarimonas ramus TaxID=690164 RepID=A0A917QBC0_9HYPH|nr:hypothetical protein [Salinarimonas ramus]GGK41237.1 hypothetical protein GCM10011322_30440 [Salinarimonas ramus]
MTPRWRALLFFAVAALLQLAFVELRLDARAEASVRDIAALGETAIEVDRRTSSGLRESRAAERGGAGASTDGAGKSVLLASPPALDPTPALCGARSGREAVVQGSRAPRERCPTGPPGVA